MKEKVVVIFANGKTIEFQTITSAAQYLGMHRITIHKHLNGTHSKNKKGLSFKRVDEPL